MGCFAVQQKLTEYCKSVIIKLKKNKKFFFAYYIEDQRRMDGWIIKRQKDREEVKYIKV